MPPVLRQSILVVLVLLMAGVFITPPTKQLRLGKDLRGGVSLVYSVQMRPTDDAEDVLGRTIEVLKDRVDPNGVLEISMVAQGRDRIEITMPLPGEEVKALRADFEAELEELADNAIRAGDIDRALRLDGAERAPRFAELAAGRDAVSSLLETLAGLYDRGQSLRESLGEATDGGADEQTIDGLVAEVADVELEYERVREQVLATAISPDEVRRALELSSTPRRLSSGDDGEFIELPSPRARALEQLREKYPSITGEIDSVVATYDTYASQRRTLDDPADLKRLLSGAGVLSFRIALNPGQHPEESRLREEIREQGPRGVRARDAAWYKVNNIDAWYDSTQELESLFASPSEFFRARGYVAEEYAGEYYMLLWDQRGLRLTNEDGGAWEVSRSFATTDQLGRPAIGFEMNALGARLLGELTGENVGENMAVLLDGEVYTAPNLIDRISSNGQITGQFSSAELSYIIRVLSAGSLQAAVSPDPIAEFQVAPELGADNLRKGMIAGIWALGIISVFMVFYYFQFGLVAVLALSCNALLILGAMAANKAAFTLPGIAGVILTFGMAVDANVLIYERIREELRKGIDLRIATRLGYQKALSSIVDGNVTNLIVCLVLANYGTQEIKGFAITLGIGVVATMFSALVITRLIFTLAIDTAGVKKLAMLPMVVPALERALEPKVNWLRLRPVFLVVSATFVSIGIGMIAFQGSKMLDNEFLGGTQVTLSLVDKDTGEPALLERPDVEDMVHAIGDRAADGVEAGGGNNPQALIALRTAQVLAVDPQADGVTSDTFTIKTTATDRDEVLGAMLSTFSEYLEALPPVSFQGIEASTAREAPIYRVISGVLGEDADRPEYREQIDEYRGGLVVMLEGLTPAVTLDGLRERVEAMRAQPDFSAVAGRTWDVIALEGTPEAVTAAAVLVIDPNLTFFDDEESFASQVFQTEWEVVREAMQRETAPAQVQNFSPAIAASFKAQAIVAVGLSLLLITIYIWVRFGSVRYSMAALITLTHDVLIAIGLIALAEIVYDFPATAEIAAAIGVQPFKINLTLVAAFLTIIGYSLNDTIIIMDRIRENRGKLPYATTEAVNLAINQTISRTVITSGTTLVATLILYIFGGEGVRAFSYALIIGVAVGTYSSIAVAAPLVWSKRRDRTEVETEARGIAPVSS